MIYILTLRPLFNINPLEIGFESVFIDEEGSKTFQNSGHQVIKLYLSSMIEKRIKTKLIPTGSEASMIVIK